MCSFFLVWKRRYVSLTHSVFGQAQGILYTAHFCLSPSGSWHVRLISLIFLPGLKAIRKECQLAVLLNCSDNPFTYGIVTFPQLSCSSGSLLSICWLRSLFHKSCHGFSGVPIGDKHVLDVVYSLRQVFFITWSPPALCQQNLFIMVLFILSGWLDLFLRFMFVWVFL